MSKYRKQVMEFAEREAGVVVQFAGMAGIYDLPRSHSDYESCASRLRAAKAALGEVSFELDGHRILTVE